MLPSFAWKLTVLTRVSGLLPNYIPHHLPYHHFFISHSDMRNGGFEWLMHGLAVFYSLKFSFCDTKVVSWMHAFFFIISEQQWVETWRSRGLNFTIILHNFSVTWKLANNFERREHFVFKRIFGVTMRSDMFEWKHFHNFGVTMKHGCLICLCHCH